MRASVFGGMVGVLWMCAARVLGAPGDIYVANLSSNSVTRYNGVTGALIQTITGGAMSRPTGVCFGPDGKLYVASSGNNRILKFDPETGAFLSNFSTASTLATPFSITFGKDNNLYVSASGANVVRKYNGTSGAFAGLGASGGGLRQPIGTTFDASGNLFVASSANGMVLKYNPANGSFAGIFASGFGFVSDVKVRGDILYASDAGTGRIRRFDVATGADLGDFGSLSAAAGAFGMTFGLDGSLIVGAVGQNKLYRIASLGATATVLSDQGMSTPENIVVQVPGPGGIAAMIAGIGVWSRRRRR